MADSASLIGGEPLMPVRLRALSSVVAPDYFNNYFNLNPCE